MLEPLVNLPLHFALIVFRLAGLMVFAPLVGSDRLPRPIKLYLAVALALCVCGSIGRMPRPTEIPESPWLLIVGIGGEIAFGLITGLLLSLAFVAAQWAGGLAGQQMGFNMAGNFNPTADFGASPLGDAYFILTLLLFLHLDFHEAMIVGVFRSFDALPPLSVGVNPASLELLVGGVGGAAALAMRLAAPICTAMLVVDLSLGMLGKTIPSLNLLSVGLSVRALVGLVVVILGLTLTGTLLVEALDGGVQLAETLWTPTGLTGGVGVGVGGVVDG